MADQDQGQVTHSYTTDTEPPDSPHQTVITVSTSLPPFFDNGTGGATTIAVIPPEEQPALGEEIEVMTVGSSFVGRPASSGRPGSFMNFTKAKPAAPRVQMSKPPSLLRRSRGPANNPLLNHFLLGSSGSSTATQAEAAQVKQQVQIEQAAILPPVSSFLRPNKPSASAPSSPVEEIVIWQPDSNNTCEIIEVEESDLARFLQQKHEGDDDIQQIIVCQDGMTDNELQFSDMLQGFMVEVIPPATEEDIAYHDLDYRPGRRRKGKKEDDDVVLIPKKKTITELKCQEPECSALCHNVQDMRKHLQGDHGIHIEEETIHFTTEEDFKRWRAAYERDRRVSFIFRGGTKKITPDRAVTYLICHRSGTYKPAMSDSTQRRRKMKPQGSCKIGTYCTAGIKLLKHLNTGIVEATICHSHYGHELDTTEHLRLNPALKKVLIQKFNEGLDFGQVLQYVHHNPEGLEGFRLIDRRAIRNIYDQWKKPPKHDPAAPQLVDLTRPLASVPTMVGATKIKRREGTEHLPLDLKPSVSVFSAPINIKVEKEEAEISEEMLSASAKVLGKSKKNVSVDEAVENLLAHGESGAGPTVLLYKKYGETTPHTGESSPLLKKDDLCMILQTPIQRQLLQQFGKVIHLELVEGQDMDVLAIVVLDDFLMAIPVAWMVCNCVTDSMIQNFFRVILTNCVEIHCDFLFATKKSNLHRIWCNTFATSPTCLYPLDDVLREFKNLLRKHFEDPHKRNKCYELLENMAMTPDRMKFEDTCKDLKRLTQNDGFEKAFTINWFNERSKWAFYGRPQVHIAMEESFVKLRKFILFKGTKTLGKNVDSILKIGYDKCFQHNKNLFKGDIKVKGLVDEVEEKHKAYSKYDWSVERVSSNKYKMSLEAGDNIVISDVGEVFDVIDLQTVCSCRMRCEECGVCIHRFWCSCRDLNLCLHAHVLRVYLAAQGEAGYEGLEKPELPLEDGVTFGCEDEEDLLIVQPEPISIPDPEIEVVPIQVQAPKILSARKMKNSAKKPTPVPASKPAADPAPSPPPPEPELTSRRSTRLHDRVGPGRLPGPEPTAKVGTRKRPAEPEVPAAEVPSRRGRKVKEEPPEPEPEPEPDVRPQRGRGRPSKPSSSPSTSKPSIPSPELPPNKSAKDTKPAGQEQQSKVGRPRGRREEASSVRGELLTLLNRIDSIKSPRVLRDVKKRIAELSGVVNEELK